MLNTCPACGIYRADKTVRQNPDRIVCPECGEEFPFLRQPLFILAGASGTGKSTICRLLVGPDFPVVVLDSDILWSTDFAPKERWPAYFDLWLRTCKSIGQSGKPVLLCGGGFGVPENLIRCPEARYFSDIPISALGCEESQLEARLRARPDWRGSSDADGLEAQLAFNRWFMQFADGSHPQITVFDTTGIEPSETAQQVQRWLLDKLPSPGNREQPSIAHTVQP